MTPATDGPSNPAPSNQRVSIDELRAQLRGKDEIALLDVREEYDYAEGHILLATLLPLSHLELRIASLVPRRETPVVVCDSGNDELAAKAAARLLELGYRRVKILAGGVRAWQAEGHQVFTTTHVLAKTLGGLVERAYGTPNIKADQLMEKLEAGEDVKIFDARTLAEFQAGSLPGAYSCPLAELVERVPDAVRSPDTLVVINCASRTRGILGAQSLLNLGLKNPIAVLENGVMAWRLAGGEVVSGSEKMAPSCSVQDRQRSTEQARRLAALFDIPLIDLEELTKLRLDEDRSTYLFDIRGPEAYAAGHWREARSAPGGQLIMTLPQFVGTHRARLVLTDGGEGLRAVTTASWLKQIGRHDIRVLLGPLPPDEVVGGDLSPALGFPEDVEWISSKDAWNWQQAGHAVILDLESSLVYRERHVSGSVHAIRSRLPAGLQRFGRRKVILTSSDAVLAVLAAADLAKSHHQAFVIREGTVGWEGAGFPTETGVGESLHSYEDVWPSPMRETVSQLNAFQSYIDWEVSVADQVLKESTAEVARTTLATIGELKASGAASSSGAEE